ncbi:hypothetical protein V2J09_016640 [Rumex salicifolius]
MSLNTFRVKKYPKFFNGYILYNKFVYAIVNLSDRRLCSSLPSPLFNLWLNRRVSLRNLSLSPDGIHLLSSRHPTIQGLDKKNPGFIGIRDPQFQITSPMTGIGSSGECSSSTSFNSLKETDNDQMIAIMLSEEYDKLDSEVAKRLSNLAPVPVRFIAYFGTLRTLLFSNILVPRINSFIPTYSDASMDHQRLIQRLQVYGLCEVRVSGDGNCQFRALSDQMFRSPEYHKHVRKDIVKQLKEHRPFYEGYVPMEYKKYYKKIAKSGEWGDHVTLQAAADRFGAKICLLTSFRDTCFIEILPRIHEPKRVLWLSFWSEVHYNSLYTIQAAPIQQKASKRHWLF